MKTDEFNERIGQITEDFIDHWLKLVDKFAEENELSPNYKLTCFLYSHLGIERVLSDRVWKLGEEYIEEVVAVGKELRTPGDEKCPECGAPATHPSGICRDCHQAKLEAGEELRKHE